MWSSKEEERERDEEGTIRRDPFDVLRWKARSVYELILNVARLCSYGECAYILASCKRRVDIFHHCLHRRSSNLHRTTTIRGDNKTERKKEEEEEEPKRRTFSSFIITRDCK